MSKPHLKKIAAKLTSSQWDIVLTALFEYGYRCDDDADNNDGSRSTSLNAMAISCRKVGDRLGGQIFLANAMEAKLIEVLKKARVE